MHFVLWFAFSGDALSKKVKKAALTDEAVTTVISTEIQKLLGLPPDKVDFVWYPNPKPTVHDDDRLHHVQVFWRMK